VTENGWHKIAAPVFLPVEARPIIIDRIAASAKITSPDKNGRT
jgi:hypothetical protein